MSIGLSFTGKIDSPKALLEGANILAEERKYRLTAGDAGMKVIMCPLGGELGVLWRPEEDPAGPWLVRGGCVSTPAGAGLHRAAAELLDSLPIQALTVEDETGFYRHRDFRRMKEEHFYPWLRTLVDVCRQESGKAAVLGPGAVRPRGYPRHGGHPHGTVPPERAGGAGETGH